MHAAAAGRVGGAEGSERSEAGGDVPRHHGVERGARAVGDARARLREPPRKSL